VTGITRYIFKQLIAGALIISLALTCIVWLTQSLRFLQFVVTRGLSLSSWVMLTLYLMPGFLAVVIPPAFFFATLFVYNKLTADRELVVAQAAGISRLGLTQPAILAAICGALACYAITLYIAPLAVRDFRELQWSIRNDVSNIFLREGVFNQITQGLTVYVRGRSTSGELEGIMVHDTRAQGRPITLLAQHGVLLGGGTGPHVLLYNGTRQELAQSGDTMSVLYFDSYTVDFGNVADESADRVADYRERPLNELLRLGPADGIPAREVGRMRAEAHQRMSSPLDVFGFTMVALAFLLRGGFDRRGQLPRLSAAVAVLIALEAAGLGAAEIVGRTPELAVLMYMVGLLPAVLGLYIIARPVEWFAIGRRSVSLHPVST
jgi:lipopolysaccharide export system permease protein